MGCVVPPPLFHYLNSLVSLPFFFTFSKFLFALKSRLISHLVRLILGLELFFYKDFIKSQWRQWMRNSLPEPDQSRFKKRAVTVMLYVAENHFGHLRSHLHLLWSHMFSYLNIRDNISLSKQQYFDLTFNTCDVAVATQSFFGLSFLIFR